MEDLSSDVLEWLEQKKSEILSYIIEIDDSHDLPIEKFHLVKLNEHEKNLPHFLIDSFDAETELMGALVTGQYLDKKIQVLKIYLRLSQKQDTDVLIYPSFLDMKINLVLSKLLSSGRKIN